MTKKFNQYLGKAGHLAVMSEFLIRRWNVAIPEVDIGDDIYVVQDENGALRKVQVKTSSTKKRVRSFSGQFQIAIKQLKNETDSRVYYVFILSNTWTLPVIVIQDYLLEHLKDQISFEHDGNSTLYFSYTENANKVKCSGHDFSKYICDYSDFPLIEH